MLRTHGGLHPPYAIATAVTDRRADDNPPNAWIAVNAIATPVADRRADDNPPSVGSVNATHAFGGLSSALVIAVPQEGVGRALPTVILMT